MVNQLNSDLSDVRHLLEHYRNILDMDFRIKSGSVESDGRPLLSDDDIVRINEKIEGLVELRDSLLRSVDDVVEVTTQR